MSGYSYFSMSALNSPGNIAKARPSDVRRNNRSLIFSLLFPSHQYSRAELGRRTGLSHVAVSDVINSMLDEGLLQENGPEINYGKGRKGTLLSINSEKLRIVSVDLSQDHLIQGAVTNLLGSTLRRNERALNPDDTVDIAIIGELIDELITGMSDIIGIGIAVPGVIDDNAIVRYSTIIDWYDVDVRTPIEERFRIPVTVDNDAASAMLSERFFGKGGANLLFVHIRRGVGGAILIDDRTIVGENHASGEIGHISLDANGPLCPCGKRGCLEQLISPPVLRESMQRASEKGKIEILEQAGRYLAMAVAMPVGLLDMADVCVYGPPDVINSTFLNAAQQYLDSMTASSFHARTRIRRCQRGTDATLQGEAICVARGFVNSL